MQEYKNGDVIDFDNSDTLVSFGKGTILRILNIKRGTKELLDAIIVRVDERFTEDNKLYYFTITNKNNAFDEGNPWDTDVLNKIKVEIIRLRK